MSSTNETTRPTYAQRALKSAFLRFVGTMVIITMMQVASHVYGTHGIPGVAIVVIGSLAIVSVLCLKDPENADR